LVVAHVQPDRCPLLGVQDLQRTDGVREVVGLGHRRLPRSKGTDPPTPPRQERLLRRRVEPELMLIHRPWGFRSRTAGLLKLLPCRPDRQATYTQMFRGTWYLD